MNVMFLAPQPFYKDRGTPIAIHNMLYLLSERGERVDVITYHEGEDIVYPNVSIHRIKGISFVENIPAGFSWKKILCDISMFFMVLWMASRKKYQLVHAVEESVFMALILKLLFKYPYVYDMDSSLAQQIIEQIGWLAPFRRVFAWFEGFAVNQAEAIVPVCDALAEVAEKHDPQKVFILRDVSLLEENGQKIEEDFRQELGILGPMLMYVGNLQPYQGIDLLLDSFARANKEYPNASLVIIGGSEANIHKYETMAQQLGIETNVFFVGPRPLEYLSMFLAQADILVSPRIKGTNTPMKVYSYLHSGKPMLATNMPTHTQVVDETTAALAEATPEAFAESMMALLADEALRERLGAAGRALVEEKYSYSVFHQRLNQIYDWLKSHFDDNVRGSKLFPSSNPL